MSYELDIAHALMKSKNGRKFPFNSNIVLSTLGIIVGVAVLILVMSIYDGYIKKLETVTFSMIPHVMIRSGSGTLWDTEAATSKIEDEFEAAIAANVAEMKQIQSGQNNDLTLEQQEDKQKTKICQKIENGEIILSKVEGAESAGLIQDSYIFTQEKLQKMMAALSSLPGTITTAPLINESARFQYSHTTHSEAQQKESIFRVLGVQLNDDKHYVPEIERAVDNHELLKMLQIENTVLISEVLYQQIFDEVPPAENIHKKLNMTLQVDITDSSGKTFKPHTELTVVGIFRLGIHKVADNMLVSSLATAQNLLAMQGSASMLGITLKHPFQSEQSADAIEQIFKYQNIRETFILHWRYRMGGAGGFDDFFNMMDLFRKLIAVVLLMSIVITAFNVYNNLSIMMLERRRQIGILLAMGMKKQSIYNIFIIISQIEGITGSLLGIGLGSLGGYWFNQYLNIHLADFLPVQDAGIALSLDVVIGIIVLVCTVCAITSFILARQAARLNTVEALQSE
ncbi:ABC transporter permease [Candidatus Venteria ishoeyi]|uniref:Macrolide export ATP-binding/permease protein MacB n=1 Tax=Candidatus Venteria ishoeyi TaxID=1899563 RepID=A0A1H6F3T1_9GAMM|nr:FtsX-like permease family protein [Candidatus Venteria ishoeyi]SEH04780.1 Macrolide export ATP-binding/permease protein MacB [Candidatus Venteria ishoeyi]